MYNYHQFLFFKNVFSRSDLIQQSTGDLIYNQKLCIQSAYIFCKYKKINYNVVESKECYFMYLG
jgi:hypothetical protein